MNQPIDLPNGLTQLSAYLLCELGNEDLKAALIIQLPTGEWKGMSNTSPIMEFLSEGINQILEANSQGEFASRIVVGAKQ